MATFYKVAKKWERRAIEVGDTDKNVQSDLGMAKALFPAYVAHYAKSDAKRIWVEIEQVFDLPPIVRTSPDRRLIVPRRRGKVDGVFQYPKANSLWALETKTASDINDDTLSLALAFDFQCLFYLNALGQKLKRPFGGVLYNVIRKPKIGMKDDKTTEEYVEKIMADIKSRPDFYFVRYELSFPPQVQARFFEELKIKGQDFIDWWEGKLPTYRNESACRGKWNCEFLQVCAAGGDPDLAGFVQSRQLFRELLEDD